jgi:sulfur-carrier protein
MSVKVRIPVAFRRATNGTKEAILDAATLMECLQALETEFPGVREKTRDEQGEVMKTLNFFVDGQNVRNLAGMDTCLNPGDEVTIILPLGGG